MGKTGSVKLDEFFAALADRTRLRLLNLMRDGEVCVCFFAETLHTNNPKISRHLAYLKRAGLVKSRRDGKWMHYSISAPKDPKAAGIFDSLMRALELRVGTVAARVVCGRVIAEPVRQGLDDVRPDPGALGPILDARLGARLHPAGDRPRYAGGVVSWEFSVDSSACRNTSCVAPSARSGG